MRLPDPYIITSSAVIQFMIMVICRACGNAEYEANGECCPMCPAGYRVYRHCKEDSSTTCVLCNSSTYTDSPNGLSKCLVCTVCDEGRGLRTKRECGHSNDALCEPLSGYYCLEIQGESCKKASEHSTCLPGQYIKQNGTAYNDTICMDCPDDSYSDGSFSLCKPHTKCEFLGQIITRLGTKSSDSVCTDKRSHFLLVVVFSLHLMLCLGVTVQFLCLRNKVRM